MLSVSDTVYVALHIIVHRPVMGQAMDCSSDIVISSKEDVFCVFFSLVLH